MENSNTMLKEQELKSDSLLFDRLEKNVKGTLTAILILGIIRKEKRTYGWQIKKKLKDVTKADSYIKDSSLYTILRSLENNHGLVTSEMNNRRRYYSLTELGQEEIPRAYHYWIDLILVSKEAFEKLDFETNIISNEVY